MTNYEKIKNMSIDEMADFLYDKLNLNSLGLDKNFDCWHATVDFLESEVKEND